MDAFWMTLAYFCLGLFITGVLFLVVAVCYSTLHYMRKDHTEENRSEESWNTEHNIFDTVTEFRDDFS